MGRRWGAVLALLALGALVVHLLSPTGGYVFVAGESMAPTIPAGCSVVSAQSWDGESSLEGEIVAFDSDHLETDAVGASPVRTDPWVAHRVVAEYESYDADEASHYVTPEDRLVVERAPVSTSMETPQRYHEARELEGERVFVFKGDNNGHIDPVLVHEDDVLGILDEDERVTLQDADSWPCSALQ